MRLIFALLAITAASVMGDGHIESNELSGKYLEFKNQLCLTDDHKRGSNGHEYHKKEINFDDCKAFCDQDDACTGFEYQTGKKCEIWKEVSLEFKTEDTDKDVNASCNWKPPEKYKRFKNQLCLTDDHKRGSNGHEYHKKEIDFDACEAFCDQDDACTGFEYQKGKKCEIWKEVSLEFKTEDTDKDVNASCNWKNYRIFRDSTCLTDDKEKGKEGEEFYVKELNLVGCRAKCDEKYWCTGFEYKKGLKCEIWNEPSDKFRTQHARKELGALCYWKQGQAERYTNEPTFYTEYYTNEPTFYPTHYPTSY